MTRSDVVTIGRHPECDIVLDDPRVSHRHALVFAQKSNFYLRNLSQTNAIYLNYGARQLARGECAILKPGHNFQIGLITLEVTFIKKLPTGTIVELVKPVQVRCARCRQTVDLDLKDCPWCGASLANAVTIW
jgi:pSer/pThr/pTyr-binding forkhead associated (FHA) protein